MDEHKHIHHDCHEHHHEHAHEHKHGDHHGHHHALGHHHHSATGNIKVAFWLNISFALFELVGGFFTSSIAILSDALHDFGDALSLGVAWYLQKLSERGRDARFSYGYKRFSLLGALFISVVLIVGSIFVLTAAAKRLIEPGEPKAGWMLVIAVVGLVVNGVAALRVSKGHSFNERAVMLHLLEDVLGWAAVLIVSVVMVFVHLPILDPILSIAISCWVLFNVVRTLIGTFKVFLQGVPTDIDLPALEQAIAEVPEVLSTHDVHLWSIDGELHVLTIHVVFNPESCVSPTEVLALKERVRAIAKEAGVQHATIEMDAPDTLAVWSIAAIDARMITPITPSATQPLEEEEEQVGFGSHNIYAPNFSLFSALSFFPWQEFFVANGFDGEFPAIIYSDDRAEQLYQEVMGQLDLLAQDPSLHCALGLTYQSDEQNMGQGLTGLLEVELTTKTLPDFLTFSGQSGTSILPYIFQTISLWVANEIRGFGEPFPLVSATSLAPLEISDAQGYRATYTLRLPSVPSDER